MLAGRVVQVNFLSENVENQLNVDTKLLPSGFNSLKSKFLAVPLGIFISGFGDINPVG